MAISRSTGFNSVVSGVDTSTVTLAYTAGSGADFLGVAFYEDKTSDIVTGVTCNGSAMSRGLRTTTADGEVYVYYINSPTTGNVVVSMSTNAGEYGLGIQDYVTGTTGIDGTGGCTTGSATSADTTGTPGRTSDWGFLAVRCNQGTQRDGTNSVHLFQSNDLNPPNFGFSMCDTNTTVGTTGSYTMNMTCTGSAQWTNSMMFIKGPLAAGPSNLKTYNTNVKSNIKTIDTNTLANVKSLNTNT